MVKHNRLHRDRLTDTHKAGFFITFITFYNAFYYSLSVRVSSCLYLTA